MINEQLKEFGLSDKETKVYLSLLEIGSASVQEITDSSEINRSTVYMILESLRNRGLINIEEKTNAQIYSPISPELLLQKTAELINKYSAIEKDIKSIIPDLQSLSKDQRHHPRVLFFEGIDGIRRIREDVLLQENGTVFRIFCQPKLLDNLYSGCYIRTLKKMSDRGMKVKAIQPTVSKNSTPINLGTETLYIPNEKYRFTSDLAIYGNKVILISPHDIYGVIIENEDIAHAIKELFDLAWEEAKRIDRENK